MKKRALTCLLAASLLPAGSGFAAPSNLETFDLMPTSDRNSLQAALYWGMQALYEVDGGDFGLTIEALGSSMYSMTDGATHLTCAEQGGAFGCGFTLEGTDINPDPLILDIGTSTSEASIQSAVLQFVLVYLVFESVKDNPLEIEMIQDAPTDPVVFVTSTATMTSTMKPTPDDSKLIYGMTIELPQP